MMVGLLKELGMLHYKRTSFAYQNMLESLRSRHL